MFAFLEGRSGGPGAQPCWSLFAPLAPACRGGFCAVAVVPINPRTTSTTGIVFFIGSLQLTLKLRGSLTVYAAFLPRACQTGERSARLGILIINSASVSACD